MTSTALEPGLDGTSVRRSLATVLAVVGIPMFMVTLDNLVVTNALPVIKSELGASLTDLQWFINAYTLSFAALLLTASAIGDRIGRRRMFLFGIALFTLASAACARSKGSERPR
jgi:MFS family permease